VILVIRLKIRAVPARRSRLARHNTARYGRNGSEGQRSNRKDEDHFKKTVGGRRVRLLRRRE
jgi:hypothetical protein